MPNSQTNHLSSAASHVIAERNMSSSPTHHVKTQCTVQSPYKEHLPERDGPSRCNSRLPGFRTELITTRRSSSDVTSSSSRRYTDSSERTPSSGVNSLPNSSPAAVLPQYNRHQSTLLSDSDTLLDASTYTAFSDTSLATTTTADSAFQQGLAQLDANIAKLEESLRNSATAATMRGDNSSPGSFSYHQ